MAVLRREGTDGVFHSVLKCKIKDFQKLNHLQNYNCNAVVETQFTTSKTSQMRSKSRHAEHL